MYITFEDLCNTQKRKDGKHINKITLKLLPLNAKLRLHMTNLNHFPCAELYPL